ncbi:MAG: cysteine rich repeat-containing protein [Gallionella sp.]
MKNRTVFSGMQMNWLAVVAGVFCLSMAAGVSAEEVDRPCMADAKKLCKDVQPGEGRIASCMKEHEKELSPGCKENIKKVKEKTREIAEACKGDAEKVCKDVKPAEGRILKCLKQHEAELSPSCKEQMNQPRSRG